jgi:hypothetical protein
MAVSQPDDAGEIEADRIADRIMQAPIVGRIKHSLAQPPDQNTVHRNCNSCDSEEEIYRKPLRAGTMSSANIRHVHEAIHSGGHPLGRDTRDFFESRLGYDLSSVRIHTGGIASQSAKTINARAYTVGSDIVFGSGEYQPHSESGRRLLAHELAHVVQQIQDQANESETIQRQPASPERKCVPGLAIDDPVCSKTAPQTGAPPKVISIFSDQAALPAGAGLLVPPHQNAVHGIHDWSLSYAAANNASNHNKFRLGTLRLQQICESGPTGAPGVYVYYVSDTKSDDKYAVGPDSLKTFVAEHGGLLIADGKNTDQLEAGRKIVDPRTLPAAAEAFAEDPQMYYVAPKLPAYDAISDAFILGNYYDLRAYLRRRPDGTTAVLYYIAQNLRSEMRPEYVVGPAWINFFAENLDMYAGVAAFSYPLQPGAMPARYQALSARFVMGVMKGDPERASSGLEAWVAAAKDPGFWLQVIMAYASAARPATPTPRPTGPPIRGVIQGGKTTVSGPAEPVVPTGTSVRSGPYISSQGAARALAPEVAPVTEPVAATPAPAPRHLQSVPAGDAVPATPTLSKPLGPVASSVGVGAASVLSVRHIPKPDVDRDLDQEQRRNRCTYQSIGQQFGRYPCHAAFATHLSGVSREVRVLAPDGESVDFDAMDYGQTLYEVKTGYRWLVFMGDPVRQNEVITRFWAQAVRQLLVAESCGHILKWYFNDPYVASFFGAVNSPYPNYFQAPLPVPVWYEPFNCDVDSDG